MLMMIKLQIVVEILESSAEQHETLKNPGLTFFAPALIPSILGDIS